MPYSSLREFMDALDSAGELHRVTTKVSPILEIAEIADRVSKSPAASISEYAEAFDPQHYRLGGRALLFENVEGASMPLLINAFGSYRRMEMALGCTEGGFAALAKRVEKLTRPQPPMGLMEKLKRIPELARVLNYPPKVTSSGACQQVIKTGPEVNLFELPMLKCWPLDGDPRTCGYPVSPEQAGTAQGQGRYITFGGVYTIHPDDAGKGPGEARPSRNVGMYRLQLVDRNHAVMHWHLHHDGARHWRAWKQAARPMPCALALGGESVLPYAATAPMPPGVSELLLAGLVNDGGIELVPCRTPGLDLHVPANAEIIVEGWVSTEAGLPGFDPRQWGSGPFSKKEASPVLPALGPGAAFEGPFGDHTGYYSLPDRYPLFKVTAMTSRRDPIYPTTIVGLPPQEDYYMGKATERIFLPLLQTIIPDIIDYDLPMFGAFHNCAFVKIKKEYPLQARRVMHAIWGAGQMAWTKFIIVVDQTINVHDHEAVLFHLCANCDPGRDTELVSGPLDILDHAAPRLGAGHKMGFDATAKVPGEEAGGHAVRDFPPLQVMSDPIKALVKSRWNEYGL